MKTTFTERQPLIEKNKKVHIGEPLATIRMKRRLVAILQQNCLADQEIILLCIGTDRSTGDAFGPLTGTELKQYSTFSQGNGKAEVFGHIDEPVHAVNLDETKKIISSNYRNPFIVAVDAGLGRKTSVGTVEIKQGPLKPGSGVKKDLGTVGHMHLTGYVNIAGYMEYFVLQSTRLSLVLTMSRLVAISINQALRDWWEKTEKKERL